MLPGGTTRSVLRVEPFPIRVVRAEGSRLWDVDGHEYVDLLGDFTNGLLGHRPAPVLDAVTRALHDGWALGGYSGYNYQTGNFVFGVEGDVKYDWNEDKFDLGGIPMELKTDWGGSLRARMGYALDRSLIYATGGYAFTNAELRDRDTGDSDSKTFNGWTIGAGFEHAFTDNFIGRAEYRYTDYGDADLMGVNTDLKRNDLMLGVGWKF